MLSSRFPKTRACARARELAALSSHPTLRFGLLVLPLLISRLSSYRCPCLRWQARRVLYEVSDSRGGMCVFAFDARAAYWLGVPLCVSPPFVVCTLRIATLCSPWRCSFQKTAAPPCG
ncbi:hypothetical protein C8R45DRAFT_1005605 [Mycena sanguinolenta]|nr:hypothetical protein C8R45DRAFT_1005605 [Mycena sanguinolenta]